jgi:hypothetical protein
MLSTQQCILKFKVYTGYLDRGPGLSPAFLVDGFLAGSLGLRGDKTCSNVAHVYSSILCTIFPRSQAPVVATRAWDLRKRCRRDSLVFRSHGFCGAKPLPSAHKLQRWDAGKDPRTTANTMTPEESERVLGDQRPKRMRNLLVSSYHCLSVYRKSTAYLTLLFYFSIFGCRHIFGRRKLFVLQRSWIWVRRDPHDIRWKL